MSWAMTWSYRALAKAGKTARRILTEDKINSSDASDHAAFPFFPGDNPVIMLHAILYRRRKRMNVQPSRKSRLISVEPLILSNFSMTDEGVVVRKLTQGTSVDEYGLAGRLYGAIASAASRAPCTADKGQHLLCRHEAGA